MNNPDGSMIDYPFPLELYPSIEDYLAQGFFKRHPQHVPQARAQAEADLLNADPTCDWCGESGSEADPLLETIISPPCSGHALETGFYHKACSAQAARSEVM